MTDVGAASAAPWSREELLMAGFAELRVDACDEDGGMEPEMAGQERSEARPEERPEELRLLEALLFAASEPLDEKTLARNSAGSYEGGGGQAAERGRGGGRCDGGR